MHSNEEEGIQLFIGALVADELHAETCRLDGVFLRWPRFSPIAQSLLIYILLSRMYAKLL